MVWCGYLLVVLVPAGVHDAYGRTDGLVGPDGDADGKFQGVVGGIFNGDFECSHHATNFNTVQSKMIAIHSIETTPLRTILMSDPGLLQDEPWSHNDSTPMQ